VDFARKPVLSSSHLSILSIRARGEISLMPKEPQKIGGPRQRPVSCKFCRSRKLRCSREAPCSNCISRGLPCELVKATHSGSTADDSDKAELLERIRNLETLVEQNTRLTTIASHNTPTTTPLSNPSISQGLGRFGEVAAQGQKNSIPSPSEQLDRDFAWLESIYDGTESAVSATFSLCSILRSVKSPDLTCTSYPESSSGGAADLGDLYGSQASKASQSIAANDIWGNT
jgi:hypothetical protein